jgi:hypothetical protein
MSKTKRIGDVESGVFLICGRRLSNVVCSLNVDANAAHLYRQKYASIVAGVLHLFWCGRVAQSWRHKLSVWWVKDPYITVPESTSGEVMIPPHLVVTNKN